MIHRSRPPDWDGLLTIALALVVLFATLGLAYLHWLRRVIGSARAPNDSRLEEHSWLVVPGKRLGREGPDPEFRERLDRAAALARSPCAARLVILGGRTANAAVSEARAGAEYLEAGRLSRKLPLILEDQSRNTLTNLCNLRALAVRDGAVQTPLVIVSNRYHLARLGLMAASLGLRHRLEPAE
ncbi:YdcF family protein, partial [Imhoffiella purpurea]|uniref:YdcF family protein n=1 Tax=Imhoffiella purpurea TaxID=1249627 RepID=UPI0006942E94